MIWNNEKRISMIEREKNKIEKMRLNRMNEYINNDMNLYFDEYECYLKYGNPYYIYKQEPEEYFDYPLYFSIEDKFIENGIEYEYLDENDLL